MQKTKILRLPLLLLTALLVACGGNAAAPVSTSMPESTSAPVTAVPSVAPASTSVAPAANATTPTAQSTGPLAGIPQGTTPEGYHMLGNPLAPALLVIYSDFL